MKREEIGEKEEGNIGQTERIFAANRMRTRGDRKRHLAKLNCEPLFLHFRRTNFRGKNGCVVCVAKHANNKPLTGVVFEPFEEVKKELMLVPSVPQDSLARQKFSDESEAAINEQINVEYNVSYVYHAMFAYFDRDNVALKGLAKFFKESSLEEREHAEKLMEYQNKRGGKVKLQSILMPVSEFEHAEKGDALYAMELALSLEKLTNEKLLNLHAVFWNFDQTLPSLLVNRKSVSGVSKNTFETSCSGLR
ncbi:ferritin-2 chloroplastic [Phtheirospermum japonicum]|uniref:Ferritin n=1 Tax=Phtheirospermum japonicum TaxID=374723 RepID=A0A830DI30_9LAMI|nr:ferritin-2 chloroplastic [Phtheirospermum japonicum]